MEINKKSFFIKIKGLPATKAADRQEL